MSQINEHNLDGMTTNERLFVKGLLPKFDEAKINGDVKTMRNILESVDVDEPSIDLIINKAIG